MADKAPIAGQKIKRKFMGNFIDSALPGTEEAAYVRLGKDLEEYNVEMNERKYLRHEEKSMFDRLQGIVDERQTLDDLKTTVVEVHLWDEVSEAAGSYVAYREDAIIEVSSYGGDTSGYQIPFNVHHTGNRVKGKFVLATKKFTPDAE